jgi:hypothetical protein
MSVTSSRVSTKTVSARSAGIEIVRASPNSSRTSISRVSGARAAVRRGMSREEAICVNPSGAARSWLHGAVHHDVARSGERRNCEASGAMARW